MKLANSKMRPIQLDDFDALAQIWSDTEVTRFLPSQGVAIPPENTKQALTSFVEHWQRFGYGIWSIIDDNTGAMIGYCGLRYLEDMQETEVLYGLAKENWNKGIASEAAKAAISFGFKQAGLKRIIALAFPENIASRRVLEKAGLNYEKSVQQAFGLEAVCYSIKA